MTTDTSAPLAGPSIASSIPFFDLRAVYEELREEIDPALARVAASGWYLLGSELTAFEAEYASYVGAKHCVGLANGLEALELGLRAMDVGPGDEVIAPSNTYIACWLAISNVGARPVPVEPDERTMNIDPARIEAAITSRTRVIMPVHLYGQPADMDPILSIAGIHGIRVLDDAAQAHGARYHGRRIGGLGTTTAWSFYPGKNLGAFGDAGGVTTDDDVIADRIRVLRNYGSRVKYVNEVRGCNSRLDEIQAAVLRVKLRHLDRWNARRIDQACLYHEHLRHTRLTLPEVPGGIEPAWHLYVVRDAQRDALQAALRSRHVDTLIHYPIPPHRQAAYADLAIDRSSLPIADRIHETALSLPMGPHLTREQQHCVIDAVREVRSSDT
jgi:dTDP-4-amino-4,6-dideoxygalactose transaminase